MIRVLIGVVLVILIAVGLTYKTYNPGNLLPPTLEVRNWFWRQFDGASASLRIEQEALRCDVLVVDGTSWHLQLYQAVVPLREGRKYRLKFQAKADKVHKLLIGDQTQTPIQHGMGLNETAILTGDWKPYEFTYQAKNVDGKPDQVPNFFLGSEVGTVWIKDVTLQEVR